MFEQNRNSWVSSLCFLLHQHGFAHVWESQGVGDRRAFLKQLKERLIQSYTDEWNLALQSNERYSFYYSFKPRISLSTYLINIKHIEARNLLIRVRLGVSLLNTHRLRYTSCNEDLLCPACKSDNESEKHFILVCPYYADFRTEYIPAKYYTNPTPFKLTMLLATENENLTARLAMYMLKAFRLRNAICLRLFESNCLSFLVQGLQYFLRT